MSGDTLVRVDGASKKYSRSLKHSLWYGLQDTAADILGRAPDRSLRPQEFWAVNDVSLTLQRGECLGLIGPNGAGKTTLLKMLNGLIKPDRGRIELRGRVGALISLGAGFNPILTGRENIYVNGSVLGLATKEIDTKLEEIVDFAGIGPFVDTPVQNYSSGMQVRLGFAVATALRPDVLLLDEILAVGDVAFRAKCYDRLAGMREEAAFMLVSHDTDQIARVCSRVLLLEGGCERFLGDVGEGIKQYRTLSQNAAGVASHEHTAATATASLESCADSVGSDGLLRFTLSIELEQSVPTVDVRVVLWGEDGAPVLDSYSRAQGWFLRLSEGLNVLPFALGPVQLRRGHYALTVVLLDRATNLHLYWGDRIRTIAVDGPVTAAVSYTPTLSCLLEGAQLVQSAQYSTEVQRPD